MNIWTDLDVHFLNQLKTSECPFSCVASHMFLPCLFVGLFVGLLGLFVCLRPTLTKLINIQLLKIATWYLVYICVTSSHTFLRVKYQGQRSFFEVKGRIEGKKSVTLSSVITFHLLQIATLYLACVLISLRCTFWWVTCQVKVILQGQRSNWSSKR